MLHRASGFNWMFLDSNRDQHRYLARGMGGVAREDDDFDIAVELRHEMQLPLRGKAIEPVMLELRNKGWGMPTSCNATILIRLNGNAASIMQATPSAS